MNTTALPMLTVAIAAIIGLASCDKKASVAAQPAAPDTPQAAGAAKTQLDTVINDALSLPPMAPLSSYELATQARLIVAQYPGKTAADLLNVPEVSPKLRALLAKLAEDKALQARINSTVDLAAQIKGLDGAAKLDLDINGYDQTRTTRLLQAVLSEEPKQLVSFLIGEIGEAAPDISFGGLDRAPNGVAIVPNPTATAGPKPDLPD